MATVTGLTAPRMLEIEANSIVGGTIDGFGDLILTTHGGQTINAGQVESSRLMGVTDSSSVDLQLTGTGALETPWNLTASVKFIDASSVSSGVFDVLRIPNLTITGLLEATYRGGKAKVKVAGVLSSEAFGWASPYDPVKSRQVRLMKIGASWLIMGQVEDDDLRLEVNSAAGISTHSEVNTIMVFAREPRVIKLPSGLVMLSGLLRSSGALAGGTVIATLPVGFRPDVRLVFNVEFADTAKAITILPNGDIDVRGSGFTSGNYISIDGIAFWEASVPTWTNIGSGGSSFASGFGSNPAWEGVYGVPAYWKDPYGFVWFRGLLRNQAAQSVDNTVAINMPATHRFHRQAHLRTAGDDGFSFLGARPTSGVDWKIGAPGSNGSWHTLSPIILITQEAKDNNPWKPVSWWNNSWANYSVPQFPAGGYLLREDGLRISEGLIGSGTIGARPFVLHETEMWPATGLKIISTVSAQLRARIDIYGTEAANIDMGAFYASQGSNSWFSLDSRVWYP